MSTFYLKLTDARFALGRVSFLTAKSTHFFNGSSASLGLLSHAIRVVAFADMVLGRTFFPPMVIVARADAPWRHPQVRGRPLREKKCTTPAWQKSYTHV
jgi:hypothetical protein